MRLGMGKLKAIAPLDFVWEEFSGVLLQVMNDCLGDRARSFAMWEVADSIEKKTVAM